MANPTEVRCESCGAAHYPDGKAWTKCDCGSRVYFRDDIREKFGNPMPPKFRDSTSKSGDTEDDEDDDEYESTTLGDY